MLNRQIKRALKKQNAVMDHRLTRREIYNPNSFAIVWKRDNTYLQYIAGEGINPGPFEVRCGPEGRCILNHAFYIPETPLQTGELFNVITIFGKEIGKGLTKPSKPFGGINA